MQCSTCCRYYASASAVGNKHESSYRATTGYSITIKGALLAALSVCQLILDERITVAAHKMIIVILHFINLQNLIVITCLAQHTNYSQNVVSHIR